MKTDGIFIFTKNRIELLKRGCENIIPSNKSVFVIDDSCDKKMIHANQLFCKEKNIHYVGIEEQRHLICDLKNMQFDTDFFLKVLGDGRWNLGYARNYGLVLSALHKLEKVLFLDDDVILENEFGINSIFSLLDNNDFVGSKITGMPDDSILGHIANQFGSDGPRMHSGGCLAFRTDIIDCFFLNVYNEDWIWLYMQSLHLRNIQFGEAKQDIYDPFENFQSKIVFQEIGEVMIEGLEEAASVNDLSLTTNEEFWGKKFDERKKYLQFLQQQCAQLNEESFQKIIIWLLENYPILDAKEHANVFNNYFSQRKHFSKLYQELILN